jgi:hypothetical protein
MLLTGCQKCFQREPLPEFLLRPLSVGTGSSTWILVDSLTQDTLIAKLADLGPTTRPLVTPMEEICYGGLLAEPDEFKFPTSLLKYTVTNKFMDTTVVIYFIFSEFYNSSKKNRGDNILFSIDFEYNLHSKSTSLLNNNKFETSLLIKIISILLSTKKILDLEITEDYVCWI